MADTALTIIQDALMELGVLGAEESASSFEADAALRKLNNLIEAWNIEGLMTYGSTPYLLPLVANKSTYTIGTGGDLNIARPSSIQSAFVRDNTLTAANVYDYPLYLYSNEEWQDVPIKGLTANFPFGGVWFDDGYPLITAHVLPVPSSSQYSLVIWISPDLSNFSINTVISLAPAYKRALTYDLAQELCFSYGPEAIQRAQAMAYRARDAKAVIKAKNLQVNELGIDPRLGTRRFNFLTGGSV